MSTLKSKTGLTVNTATFDEMLQNGFGIVTVMNAKVFKEPIEDLLKLPKDEDLSDKKVYDIINALLALDSTNYIKLDTLKDTTQELIETINEVKNIHDKGAAERKEYESHLRDFARQLEISLTDSNRK